MSFNTPFLCLDGTQVLEGTVKWKGMETYTLQSPVASGANPGEIPPNDPAFCIKDQHQSGRYKVSTLCFKAQYIPNWHTGWYDGKKTVQLQMDVNFTGGVETRPVFVELCCAQHAPRAFLAALGVGVAIAAAAGAAAMAAVALYFWI